MPKAKEVVVDPATRKVEAPVFVSPADGQQAALSENRTTIVRKKGATAIMPGGKRIDASPYMHVRYEMSNDASFLGDAERILSDDWKAEHRGWSYHWPIRTADSTAALLRAGWYVAVPYDAVDKANPLAAIAEVTTPGGRYVVWKNHLLVAVPPQYQQHMVDRYEHLAISRTVTNAEATEEALNQAFGAGGFKGEVEAYTNVRANKTGD